ncbi:MAG: amino acid permease [Deltaproteobacteria bacterium]|nr:amino acid permease [Deltaproteobacteria bacterium]
MASKPLATEPLPRAQLSLLDLLCLGINAIVGSGIYAFPGLLAAMLGPASFIPFLCCGAISLLIALCFADAASRYPHSGGPYVYARAAFGSGFGFVVGWSCWAAAVLSWAAVTRALLPYLGQLIGNSLDASAIWIALGTTAALGLLNVFGIKPGAYLTDLLTVAKLAPLLLLGAVGLPALRRRRLVPLAPHGWHGLPNATFLAFFAFQGFEVVGVPASESRNPKRAVPIATIGAVSFATLLYVVVQLVAVGTQDQLAGSKDPLALVAKTLLGDFGSRLVAFAALVSMVGFCSGVALASPRYLEPLAADGLLPSWLAARHRRLATPHRAIIITTGCAALLVLALDFRALVDLSVTTVALQYLATCAAVLRFRGRRSSAPAASYRLPAGPLIPLLSLALVILMFLAQLTSAGRTATPLLWGFLLLNLVGAALGGSYWLWRRLTPPA